VRTNPDRVADRVGRTERVVTAVDGSAASQRALAWAAEEARVRDAALEVVNAWHAPSVGGYPLGVIPVDAGPFEELARKVVEDAVAPSIQRGSRPGSSGSRRSAALPRSSSTWPKAPISS
jgi:nucleotide-binding universal stress UspA family protein